MNSEPTDEDYLREYKKLAPELKPPRDEVSEKELKKYEKLYALYKELWKMEKGENFFRRIAQLHWANTTSKLNPILALRQDLYNEADILGYEREPRTDTLAGIGKEIPEDRYWGKIWAALEEEKLEGRNKWYSYLKFPDLTEGDIQFTLSLSNQDPAEWFTALEAEEG